MTKNDVFSTIMSIEGATMARANKTNFIVVPVDGGYLKVNVTMALAKDTANHKAFNADAAIAEYKAYTAEVALREAERANKPVKAKATNTDAQARRDALDAKIEAMPAFANYTATDIMNHLEGLEENVTVMAIGSSAKRLVEKGVLTMEVVDKKSYYTKA